MNDALRTDVFMRYTPESIACSCIWLAARQLRVPLPENPPWYHMVSVQLDDIQFIAASILKLYTRPKVKLETLESKVEEIRKQQQEARLRNRLLPAGGSLQQTPLQPITSTFSPSSRNHTPHVPREQSRPGQHPAKRRDRDGHNRSGSDTSTTTVGSRRSRSGVSPNRSHKKPRRSDSRDGSRSRSHSNDHHSRGRSRSRERSRDRSRDRHIRKSPSKSSSPNVTPPPRFIKNKEKGPIVQSVSRSRSRSPVRAYSKYERQDVKYGKYERKDKHISADKYTSSDKYGDKYAGNDKYDAGYDRSDKSSEKYKFDKCDKLDKYERNDKYVDKYSNDKIVKYEEKYEKVEVYSKHDRFGREEKLEISAKYVMDGKEKSNKYEKYDKVDKYERYPKYEKSEKKKAHESKKTFDNGYEKYEKVHKNKKASRHRSRSRDHRR